MSDLLIELKLALGLPSTWWQLGLLASGALFALLVDQLARRLSPAPGPEGGLGKALRAGSLILIPLVLWLWLIAAQTLLKHWKNVSGEILHIATLLTGAFILIRIGVSVLRHHLGAGDRLKAWEGALTLTIWGLVALHVLGWLPLIQETLDGYALTVGKTRVSLLAVVSFVLSLGALLLLGLWFANLLQARLLKSRLLNIGMQTMLAKTVRFVLLSVAVLAAMTAAGFDLTALAVFGGALGVGLGLGLQRIVSNIVSGFILVFEESIRPGDVIGVGNTFGTVQSLHTRYIAVRDLDGKDILIPNENLITSEITNWSYRDRNIRVKLPLQISYDDDPERAIALLRAAAETHPRVLKEPPPQGHVVSFGDNGINLELHVWVSDPERGLADIRSDLYLRLWKDFKAAGITLPFPQREVTLKTPPGSAAPRVPGS